MLKTLIKFNQMKNKIIVETYIQGFREANHDKILSCLTDDIVWKIHGHRTLQGKEAFDGEIENPNFEGKPIIELTRMTEENNVVIAEGTVQTKPINGEPIWLSFCDVFEFRDGLIFQLSSYLAHKN